MRKLQRSRLYHKPLLSAAIALAMAAPASADDTDVFSAILASQNKPNIVFVLDYSGSMRADVNNVEIPSDDTTTQSKYEILTTAVNQLLQDNKGKVNVGIGSIYGYQPSGVRWPVSDLEADANTIDADIPAGQFQVADVIAKQLTRTQPNYSTPTVNALAEAAAYFRGDPVLHNDWDVKDTRWHQPDTWDVDAERYDGGNSSAALPSSYTPIDAYKPDSPNDSYGYCTDYAGGNQGCEGKVTFECNFKAASSGTSEATVDGGGGDWSVGDRTECKYYKDDSWTTPNYISPISQACQANFIVLISDGQPTTLSQTQTLNTVLSAAGVGGVSDCEDLSDTVFDSISNNKNDGNCGPEVLEYLATNDINPNIADSSVKTFTVGFSLEGPGKEYLKLLADKGEGEFYEATKPEELTTALNDVLDSILAGSQNFAELSIDVNPNTLSHDDKTYFSLFSPSSYDRWEGNLKGFFLDETGLIDITGKPATFDDGSGLKFEQTSQSFWSSTEDGNDVMTGGASESITSLPDAPNSRKIYTYLDGNSTSLALSANNRLVKENLQIDNGLLGNPAAGVRETSLDWLANAPMGDPLHTKPLVVRYENSKIVYIMTNQGLLHAFDATTPLSANPTTPDTTGGSELFAFMPQELLKNIPDLYAPEKTGEHIYGLDGGITRWHTDTNDDGIVNGSEKILLVFGMRRGGNSYYALDVTNPTNPKFEWQVSPGDPGFSRLAQSWSRPSLITVNSNGADKRVLMFGGGFDAAKVDGKNNATKADGNAVFMVDELGKLVWSIDDTDHLKMNYSIPGDLTVIDSDNNGRVDRAYFGDLGGQLWRVDFDDITNGAQTHVNRFADVSNGGLYQPIFYPPSVSFNAERGKRFMAISFGTGDRTQPLNPNSQNAFYMLRDTDYKVGPPDASSFATITPTQIVDLTENQIGSTDETTRDTAKAELAAKDGWKVNLNLGEKSLSKVVTFEGKFLATTFEPTAALDASGNADPCSFAMLGRLYIMNVLDARPIEILADGSETQNELTKDNRVTFLKGSTIPSAPVVVFPPDSSKVQIMVDKESVLSVNRKLRTVYWHAQ